MSDVTFSRRDSFFEEQNEDLRFADLVEFADTIIVRSSPNEVKKWILIAAAAAGRE